MTRLALHCEPCARPVVVATPADACISNQTLYKTLTAFEADLHQHIHLENNILFPRAIAMEQAQ
jgi:iron-sulfur cluster repair protein YtfE (RIC family)